MVAVMKGGGNGKTPPRAAAWIVSITSGDGDRASVLGDLEEEFSERAVVSARSASVWYWRQALASALPLTARNLQRQAPLLFVWSLLVAGAVVGLKAWDVWVAQGAAWRLAGPLSLEGVTAIRALYLVVLAAGFFVAGRSVIETMARMRPSKPQHLQWLAGLAVVIVCLPGAHLAMQTSDAPLQIFRWAQVFCCAIAFFSGVRARTHK